MKIGFIGLGIMGKPMARNLMKAGYELVVYNRSKGCMEELQEKGAQIALSPADVAEKSNIIILMLPNSPEVKEVMLEKNGVLKKAKPGTIVIDMSSIAPLVSQEIFIECEKRGVKMLDAPVSGGEPKAIDGSLSIMVGGCKETFEEVYGILMKMGSSAVYCGDIGAGNTTKLANQIIVALNIIAISEAFTLSTKAGVNPQKVYAAIRGGLAGSTVMDAKVPMMIDHNFKPGFKIDLHIKDLNNALETGHKIGSPLPFTAAAMEILQTLHGDDLGQMDHSAILKYYEKFTGELL